MKLQHHGAILFLSVFFQTVVFHLPKLTYGNEISDGMKYNIIIENNQDVQDCLDVQMRFTSRSLENDDTCANACEDDSLNSFRESFQTGSLMLETEDEDATGRSGFLSRITRIFDGTQRLFGRLMNNLFKIFNRSKADDPKFMISTEYILPFLSTYSAKFKSLAAMIRQESESDAALSTKPDAIQMMYNISAMNMEAVATVLDPILNDMRQSKTIDIRTMSCNMMQILTLLRDVTVPNIQSITKLIYTATSDNAEMKDVFYDYNGTISTENTEVNTALISETSSEEDICPDASGATTLATGRLFDGAGSLFDDGLIPGLLKLLFGSGELFDGDDEEDVGPIGHIAAITLLIVLFPFSIVLSIVVGSALILGGFVLLLFREETDDRPGANDDEPNLDNFGLAIFVVALIGAPIIVAISILANLRELFKDISDPFLPGAPSPSVSQALYSGPFKTSTPMKAPFISLSVNFPVYPPASVPDTAQQTSELAYHLAAVLESPIDTFVSAVRNVNIFLDVGAEDEEVMECEMAALKCKNDGLIDVLPF